MSASQSDYEMDYLVEKEIRLNIKAKKGEFGYRRAHRTRQLFIVYAFLAVIIALLVSRRFITWNGLRNLVTVSAILIVLPMANLASPLVAAWRVSPATEALYRLCRPYEEKFPILYELIITSPDMILAVDAAVIHPSGVYLYCPSCHADIRKAEKFMNEMLTAWKLDGNARLITEEKSFEKRLSSLKEIKPEDDDGSAPYVEKLLKSLSM